MAETPLPTTPRLSPQSTPSPKRKPRYKNPATIALRTRCRAYLDDTHHSEWDFTKFWGGAQPVLVQCGDMWLRELSRIVNTAKDPDRAEAALAARNRYKQREHLPKSSRTTKKSQGSSRQRKRHGKPDSSQPPPPPPAPPPYELSSQDETTRVAKPLSLHERQHEALSNDRKWYLPGGRSVEDVLFAWVVSQTKESYAYSYILDVDDPDIKGLFVKKEWDAIVSRLSPLPSVGEALELFMSKFADVKTTSGLRHRLITTPYMSPDETYSRSEHGDQAWFHSALTSLVFLYENDHMLTTDNLEAWFQINVWGPIFDRCFQVIPGVSIKRTESQSTLNSDRKNATTINPDRKIIGSKYDGLIVHNRIEYGAVEDSKIFEGEKAKKWTSDSLKLAKLLHDQLRGLEVEVRHDQEALEGFRCVGFLTAGLHARGLLLQYGGGHVCLLSRTEKRTVPESLAPLTKLIEVFVAVWQLRAIVRESVDNLDKFLGNSEMMFRAAMGKVARLPAILPMCFDTDGDP